MLITGRTIFHFHTRTKTGRAPELQAAAPEVWVECSPADARRLGLAEGDVAEVRSPRGAIRAQVRISGIRDGVLFVPFHYGYWDGGDGTGPAGTGGRAGNELTITEWDPVSKQPIFKTAAASLTRIGGAPGPAPAPAVGGSRPAAVPGAPGPRSPAPPTPNPSPPGATAPAGPRTVPTPGGAR